jgi:DNA-binding Lrp family transcriptional regulator
MLKMDDTNIKIVNELLNNPDVRSKDISTKLRVPLSTIQRRRTKLEKTVLKKNYELNLGLLGWRIADLYLSVEKGKSKEVGMKLLTRPQVMLVSVHMGDPSVDLVAEVFYKSSSELHDIMESVKAMNFVRSVEWSEIVSIVGQNKTAVLGIFDRTSSLMES